MDTWRLGALGVGVVVEAGVGGRDLDVAEGHALVRRFERNLKVPEKQC
jgi:hypothetical protein